MWSTTEDWPSKHPPRPTLLAIWKRSGNCKKSVASSQKSFSKVDVGTRTKDFNYQCERGRQNRPRQPCPFITVCVYLFQAAEIQESTLTFPSMWVFELIHLLSSWISSRRIDLWSNCICNEKCSLRHTVDTIFF